MRGVLNTLTDGKLMGQVEYCYSCPGGKITSSTLRAGTRNQCHLYVYTWEGGVGLLSEDGIMS